MTDDHMKRMRPTYALCRPLCALPALFATARADEPSQFAWESEAAWVSRYVWRGIVLDPRPSLQTTHSLSWDRFTVELWNTGSTPRATVWAGSDEIDFSGYGTWQWGPIEVALFATSYSYGKSVGTPDTLETGLLLSSEVGSWTAFWNHYVDVWDANGAYFTEVGAERAFPVSKSVEFEVLLSAGWANRKFNQYNIGAGGSTFNVASAELSLSHGWGDGLSVRLFANASRLLDRRLRNAVDDPDNVVWGLAFGLAK